MVTTICYGEKTIWTSREDAIKSFENALELSEGSERERYTKVLLALQNGQKVATDE